MKTNQKRNNKKKGFTLIELIVVIAILGILATIAVPRLSGFQDKAKISADKATFASISKSISIAVANEDITGNVVMSVDDKGVATFTSVPADVATNSFESAPVFKLTGNRGTAAGSPVVVTSKTYTWTISGGKITDAPSINDSGVMAD